MRLEQARRMGMEVVEEMRPACDRIVIAGSVRRGKANPKDVEIVYMPRMVKWQVDMFTRDWVPATAERIERLVRDGFWYFDPVVKRNGLKYQRLIRLDTVFELFKAEKANWGLILALRTGPGDFNHLLVNRCGGAMPIDMRMADGWLWRRGIRLETPDEETFFGEIGVPCWPPAERTAERLAAYLEQANC